MTFLDNIKYRRCCGLTVQNSQCNRSIISFSTGIYFCFQHGNIILSPYHNLLYGCFNEHSLNKILSNRYFSSKTYQRNIIKKRYLTLIHNYINKNLLKLNLDVITIILKYL